MPAAPASDSALSSARSGSELAVLGRCRRADVGAGEAAAVDPDVATGAFRREDAVVPVVAVVVAGVAVVGAGLVAVVVAGLAADDSFNA